MNAFNIFAGIVNSLIDSKAEDVTKDIVSEAIKKHDLNQILDQYDKSFLEKYDTEITLNNANMQGVFNVRANLIEIARKHLVSRVISIKSNRKNIFITSACIYLDTDLPAIKIYLEGFYDIVLFKESESLGDNCLSQFNVLADQICTEINRLDRKIDMVISTIDTENELPFDFTPFYNYVIDSFTESKDYEDSLLVGTESDADSYIDAYIETINGTMPVLPFIETWFYEKRQGILLLHSEPGHGKSLLCKKAIYEYRKKAFLKNIPNVLWVSLNSGERAIIEGNVVMYQNALTWGAIREPRYTFNDCKGSLLFMDGFDELIDAARRTTNIKNIVSFVKDIKKLANEYNLHIVILSRTVAVAEYIKQPIIKDISYKLAPLTYKQQNEWFYRFPDIHGYYSEFESMRDNENMEKLLEIPLLFRMIIYNRFFCYSSNIVDLYDKLFDNLVIKRNLNNTDIKQRLMNHAYDIYCANNDSAYIDKDDDNKWILTFYLKSEKHNIVGFYHRSFYQYFLARYIYQELLKIKKDTADNFISKFAERELDETVRKYLSLIHDKDASEVIETALDLSVKALLDTEVCIYRPRRFDYGNASISRIERSTNIYRNILHICASLSYVLKTTSSNGLDRLLKNHDSSNITFISTDNNKLQLQGSNLYRAFLMGAKLNNADMHNANLKEANLNHIELNCTNLNNAILYGANLNNSFLNEAQLNEAHLERCQMIWAILNDAQLKGAHLEESHLIKAHLNGAHMENANLTGADLFRVHFNGTFLCGANLSRTRLERADLCFADLSFANLSKANLNMAYLIGTNLSKANLSNAHLRLTDLREVYLNEADLTGATIVGIKNADMIKSLDKAKIPLCAKSQFSPCTPGYDTVYWVCDDNWIPDENSWFTEEDFDYTYNDD